MTMITCVWFVGVGTFSLFEGEANGQGVEADPLIRLQVAMVCALELSLFNEQLPLAFSFSFLFLCLFFRESISRLEIGSHVFGEGCLKAYLVRRLKVRSRYTGGTC